MRGFPYYPKICWRLRKASAPGSKLVMFPFRFVSFRSLYPSLSPLLPPTVLQTQANSPRSWTLPGNFHQQYQHHVKHTHQQPPVTTNCFSSVSTLSLFTFFLLKEFSSPFLLFPARRPAASYLTQRVNPQIFPQLSTFVVYFTVITS